MQLYVIGRFQARAGSERELEAAIDDVRGPTRAEPGCLIHRTFRSTRNPLLFILYSEWVDEDAFEFHALLPHTVRFLERVDGLVDPPFEITRTTLVN